MTRPDTPNPSNATGLDKCRRLFETWANTKKLPLAISDHFINSGAYSHQDTHVAWLSFQAAWNSKPDVKRVVERLEKTKGYNPHKVHGVQQYNAGVDAAIRIIREELGDTNE